VSYTVEWMAAPVFLGAPLLLLIGPVALIAVLVVASLAALAALAALAGAVLALPYLLVRSLHSRLADRPRSSEGTAPAGRRTPQSPSTHLQQGAHHEPVAA
jgi:hypothetical protein